MALTSPTVRKFLLLALLALVAFLVRNQLDLEPGPDGASTSTGVTVEELAARHESGVMIDATGTVSRVLSDDQEGSRHQRFIVELPSGHTVLVSHNIDLAPRIPLAAGDRVTVRGQYEWNDRGGVLHWTHHDPAGRHEEGWVDHKDRRYE